VAGHIQDNASGSYRTAGTCKEPTVAGYGDRDEPRQHNEQQQRYTPSWPRNRRNQATRRSVIVSSRKFQAVREQFAIDEPEPLLLWINMTRSSCSSPLTRSAGDAPYLGTRPQK